MTGKGLEEFSVSVVESIDSRQGQGSTHYRVS
jgi:hypothetical protein